MKLSEYAFANDYLLNILFAFTALHLASRKSNWAHQCTEAANYYRNRGVKRVTQLMHTLSRDNVIPLHFLSALGSALWPFLLLHKTEVAGLRQQQSWILDTSGEVSITLAWLGLCADCKLY